MAGNRDARREARRRFAAFLAETGRYLSQPRMIILDRIWAWKGPFRAEELAARLRTGKDRVSRGSVYRTLGLLLEAGLIRRVPGSSGYRYLVPAEPGRLYVQCEGCGAVIPVPGRGVEQALGRVSAAAGFRLRRVGLQAFGLCSACSTRTRSDSI